MTCPTCGGELVPGGDRCPVCDAGAVPRVEGALAADPRLVTPPARPKPRVEPLRDIPGLRKREKTWRDEVQERVRSRRQKRADAGLPLFDPPERRRRRRRPEPRAARLRPEGRRRARRLSSGPRASSRPRRPSSGRRASPTSSRPGSARPSSPTCPCCTRRTPMEALDREARGLARAAPRAFARRRLCSPRATSGRRSSSPRRPPSRPRSSAPRGRSSGRGPRRWTPFSSPRSRRVVVYFTGRAARVEITALVSELALPRRVPRPPRPLLRRLLHRHHRPDPGQARDGPARGGRRGPAPGLPPGDGAGPRRPPGDRPRRARPRPHGLRPGRPRAPRPPLPHARRPQLSRRGAGARA